MHIVAALFVDDFSMRQVEGPSTRLDLKGVYFSQVAPQPLPCTLSPHLVVLIYRPAESKGDGVLQVVFHPPGVAPDVSSGLSSGTTAEGTPPLAQHASPFTVEPGKFTYRLVRAELPITEFGQVIAHSRIDNGPWLAVPLTILPPVATS
jgi:hypothetical protein